MVLFTVGAVQYTKLVDMSRILLIKGTWILCWNVFVLKTAMLPQAVTKIRNIYLLN